MLRRDAIDELTTYGDCRVEDDEDIDVDYEADTLLRQFNNGDWDMPGVLQDAIQERYDADDARGVALLEWCRGRIDWEKS